MANPTSCLDLVKHEAKKELCPSSDFLWTVHDSVCGQILAKLPFSSLVQLCGVCKSWRSSLLSSQISRWTPSGSTRLVYFEDGKLKICSSRGGGEWQPISLPFLLDDAHEPNSNSLYLAASAGGLLCFHNHEAFGEFIIFNPVTKYCKRLQMPCREGDLSTDGEGPFMSTPPEGWIDLETLLSPDLLVGMTVNLDARYFKIVVAAIFDGAQRTTLSYDSRGDCWKKVADVPDGVSFHMKPATCNGALYCCFGPDLRKLPHTTEFGDDFFLVGSNVPQRLLKYDSERETWSWIEFDRPLWVTAWRAAASAKGSSLGIYRTKKMTTDVFSWNIVEHKGKIWLTSRHKMFLGWFAFFEVQDSGSIFWHSLSSLSLTTKFHRWEPNKFWPFNECLAQGDAMYFLRRTDYYSGPGFIPLYREFKLLYRDASTGSDLSRLDITWGTRNPRLFGMFTPSMVSFE